MEQSRQWAVRMMHEGQMHEKNWFATLTYEDKELPANGSLSADHFQRFVKNLRRRLAVEAKDDGRQVPPISYFGCGEYGGKTHRPHCHVVLFGVEFLDRDRHPDTDRLGIWKSDLLEKSWGRGLTEMGSLTLASASYVAGYVQKKLGQADKDYERVDPASGEIVEVEREFARMSLRPAIGTRWMEKYWRDVYPRDYVVMDGVEAKPPRYYDKWMDQEHGPESSCWLEGCKGHRDIMEEVRDRRYEEAVELSTYTLKAKAKIAASRDSIYNVRDVI